jgi:hypothetical protein
MWVKLLGQLKSNLIGNRTRDFSICIIEPQPATLPRAPILSCINFWMVGLFKEIYASCFSLTYMHKKKYLKKIT